MQLSHHREGSGDPVVLIHGVGSQWQAWRPLLAELASTREVIALDLPGFGDSLPLPDGVVPDAAALADAVAGFLDSLALERPVIGGNSLGGWVALELAARGRARAVVGVSPAGFATPWEQRVARWNLAASAAAVGGASTQVEWLLRRPRGRKLALGGLVGHPERIPVADAIGSTRNLAASPAFDVTLKAITAGGRFTAGAKVDVPVTLVWGTRDMVLFPWQAKRALATLPQARLVPLPGAGHVPMWDEPAAIVRELVAA
jgi:pimeloyl-ACP methyl ester carboxylesterase